MHSNFLCVLRKNLKLKLMDYVTLWYLKDGTTTKCVEFFFSVYYCDFFIVIYLLYRMF